MSKPRPRKSPAEVSAVRQAAAKSRWDKLTPRQRRNAIAPAVAASPVNKRRNLGIGQAVGVTADCRDTSS